MPQRINYFLVIKIIFWLIVGKFYTIFFSFKDLVNKLGVCEPPIQGGEYSMELSESERWRIVELRRMFNGVIRRLPYKFNCVAKAFAFAQLLKAMQIFFVVYLGVGKSDYNKIIAHMWIRCATFDVIGCETSKQFKVIGTYYCFRAIDKQ
jgi:hypothetical protein